MITPELLMQERVILAMRLGQSLNVEPGHACFLLPADIPQLQVLEIALQRKCSSPAILVPVNEEFVEMELSGSWIAEDKDAHKGMFLTVMSDRTEFLVYKLWQMSEARISSLA